MAGSLGRNVEHDPRSFGFPAPRAFELKSVEWKRRYGPYDQGTYTNAQGEGLGSCTGNAMAGLLITSPGYRHYFHERTAVRLYELATRLDNQDGEYPPDDTGSSGLAVAKAAFELGYIKSYAHAFGLAHVLDALALHPVIVGVNWYEGFDNPSADGTIRISGEIRGGHEFELVGLDVEAQSVRAANSWGTTWGDGGYFDFSWDILDRLLSEDGDCTTVTRF